MSEGAAPVKPAPSPLGDEKWSSPAAVRLPGNDIQERGESLRSIGALSAPPPPGYHHQNSSQEQQQQRQAGDLWYNTQTNSEDGGPPELPPRGNGEGMNYPGGEGRMNSFSNLGFLGSSLNKAMEEASNGDVLRAPTGSNAASGAPGNGSGGAGNALLTDNFFFNPQQDQNYARHKRHAASRLLGSSPARDAFAPNHHKGLDSGSLLAPLNSAAQKNFPSKPVSGDGSRSPLLDSISRQRSMDDTKLLAGSRETKSGISAAFSNEDLSNHNHRFETSENKGHGSSVNQSFDQSSGGRDPGRSRTGTDIGMTVMEPSSEQYVRGDRPRTSNDVYQLERGMQNMWSGGAGGGMSGRDGSSMGKRSDQSVGNTSAASYDSITAEEELRHFTWDSRHPEPSRALAITHATTTAATTVRMACESFGLLESFRSDFADRGVFFVSYFDMRAAQYAAMDLQNQLQRLDERGDRVQVKYCVPLNSSSQFDESLVVLSDIPRGMDIESLAAMLSSYGAVRSLKSLGSNYGGASYVVEYHDVQDAKQAILELEGTQPWGPNVLVEAGGRNPADRKRGRELLALIGRWRHGGGQRRGPQPGRDPYPQGGSRQIYGQDARYDSGRPGQQQQQLVLGPDGRYTYVVPNQPNYPPSYGGSQGYPSHLAHRQPHGQQQYWNPNDQMHQQPQHGYSRGAPAPTPSYEAQSDRRYPSGSQSVPYFGSANSTGSSHMMSMGHNTTSGASEGKDNSHLMLDLDAVEAGRDSRTSLMVRNIPNKYTQQMLLSEFAEHGHGPGVIDFFYLPIDFKNRCNRGYAFINFVDYRDILPFHRRYYGKHWRTFNSDKICDITYARIQGKAAMLKRFENSALMEKDDEYKPLVFVSNGPDKGNRLPFPDPNNRQS